MSNNNIYYLRSREILLEQAKNLYRHEGGKKQAKNRFHDEVGKEQAKEYYENIKEWLQEQAGNKYR